ncbi:hypothetical protein ACFVVC_21965, partial [Pseudarthrobacter sp. NPDC058196]|uniref:hypothetical protein n=1 Tax=Pseudarthrobacter sp. NPDC058196 TaxID=3346376 RepID=UPI0036D9CA7D
TGWRIQSIQPIHKTIGINKLGTLLSSQTTDTPGTTTTKNQSQIAPEQLFKLTGSPTPMQIHIPGPTPKKRTPTQLPAP